MLGFKVEPFSSVATHLRSSKDKFYIRGLKTGSQFLHLLVVRGGAGGFEQRVLFFVFNITVPFWRGVEMTSAVRDRVGLG